MKKLTVSLFGAMALAGLLSAAPQAATPAQAPSKAVKKEASKMTSPIVDSNSASLEELKALPGVGDAYAQKIIDGRPYKGRNELLDKKILPEAVYSKVRTMVKARQPKVAKATATK